MYIIYCYIKIDDFDDETTGASVGLLWVNSDKSVYGRSFRLLLSRQFRETINSTAPW
jgi:hypothetical protein